MVLSNIYILNRLRTQPSPPETNILELVRTRERLSPSSALYQENSKRRK